ncbi:MAG: hypothetical protein AAFR87_35630 [Bacteroidota bacterium]
MKINPNHPNSIHFLIIILISGFIGMGPSCKKVGKSAGKAVTAKQGVKAISKLGKKVLPAGLILVSQNQLLAAFESATSKDPIQVEIMNPSFSPLEVQYTKDGLDWRSRGIEGRETISIKSEDKGMLGLKIGEDYFQVKESNMFSLESDGKGGLDIDSDH